MHLIVLRYICAVNTENIPDLGVPSRAPMQMYLIIAFIILLVIGFRQAEEMQAAEDEDVMRISERLIQQNHEAYEVLAK